MPFALFSLCSLCTLVQVHLSWLRYKMGCLCTYPCCQYCRARGRRVRDIASNEIDDKREELGNFIQADKELQNDKELEDLKRSALAAIAELTDVIQTAPSKDTVHTALRHIRSATAVAKGLSIIGNDHQYLKTKSFPPNKRQKNNNVSFLQNEKQGQ